MGNPVRDSRPSAPQQSSDPAPSPQPALFPLLESLRCALTGPVDHKAILALRRQIEQQAALIRQAEAVLAGAEIFERASMAARMGTWQCDLPTEQLTWSSGTYELFGLSRSSSLVRRDILKTYTDESLARLQGIRGGALEAGDGFMLDAEIRGPDFDKRWIRISATIERRNGEPVRLFGIKQDITEERRTLEHMRHLAEHDVMTGLANRTRFQMRLADICGPGGTGGVLMLVDLDGFKEINDTMGHAVGDECLIEFTRRLSETCLTADLIARIGGDEFAVIFDASASPQAIAGTAQHLVDAARHPMSCAGQNFCVSASVGFAFAEGETPTALFTNADLALYAAKAVGGNTYRGHAPGRPAGKTAAARNRKRS